MNFLSSMTLGQFIPGDSYVHGLDPRCKIAGTFLLLAGLFMASAPADFLLWGALLASFSFLTKTRLRVILRAARPVWVLVVITVVLNIFWTPGREILRLGFLRVTQEGLTVAFCMGMRLFFLVIFASLLMMTTSPMAFSDGLERLLSPLARVGFPASEMAMMMTIALRFIPTLFEETDRILKAQLSRGADFETGGILKRARSFIPVLIPLFLLVFQRAENLATAMESRCYVAGASRSRMYPLAWRARDSAALLMLCAYIALAVCMSRLVFPLILS